MKRALAVLALLILTLVLVAAGYFARQRVQQEADAAQPGWCCMRSQRQCVVKENMDSCLAGGGSMFDWTSTGCKAACR